MSIKMVPFFVVLLLSSLLMVPLPLAAAEPMPQLIAGNELTVTEPDWSQFWSKLNKYAAWNLEWYNGVSWVSVKDDLQILRDYPEPNHAKLTLIFDASHQGNYRLTFAIDEVVKNYVTHLSEYAYELNYGNFSLVWDWSDAVAIPGLVFTHGLLNDMFWFRMRRDNVPLGAHVVIDPSIIVSLTSGSATGQSLKALHPSAGAAYSAYSESFETGLAYNVTLTSIKVRINKVDLPTGNAHVKIYAHAGTYGTSSLPTGAALATSDDYDISTIGAIAYYEFLFTGANRIILEPGTYYVFTFEMPTAGVVDATKYIGYQRIFGGYSGNAGWYSNSAWAVDAGRDVFFYIYADIPPTVDSYTCTTLFTQNVQGWFNTTVSDLDGVADLTTVDITVTMALNNTFTLRWTQFTGVFSEESDPDNVCTLNTTDSVRTNVDADTDLISFLFMLTGGTEGNYDVIVTATDDYGMADVETYASASFYTTYDWDPIKDIIDSGFALFGVTGYVTQAITFVNGISAQFTKSLVGIVTLINLQFQVIWGVFGWFTGWAARMINAVLNIGNMMRNVMNGIATGTTNIWTFFSFDTMPDLIDGFVLFLIVVWINSMIKRGRTQGDLNVLMGDLQTFANVFSFFISAFITVVSLIEGKIQWLASFLP